MSDTALINKYRPLDFDEVIGQDPVVASLKTALDRGDTHAFLFTGPSGVGKTTLARIVAATIGCDAHNVMEIDAATHTGIDSMREVTSTLRYRALGSSPCKAVLMDEAHRLSAQSWSSLLKSVEEPPPHVYWLFCTTDAGKVPKTITSRCARYDLKSVRADALFDYMTLISEAEELGVDPSVIDLVVKEADGGVRRALSNLSMCAGCTDRKAAAKLLASGIEDPTVIDLCRYLIGHSGAQSPDWARLMKYVAALDGMEAEGVRLTILAYFTKVAMGKTNPAEVAWALNILSAFSVPYNRSDKHAPLVLSLGSLVFD